MKPDDNKQKPLIAYLPEEKPTKPTLMSEIMSVIGLLLLFTSLAFKLTRGVHMYNNSRPPQTEAPAILKVTP